MLGLYFSGTGNSRYALEVFLKKYCTDARIFAIEDEMAPGKVRENEEIIFSYSVQYSSIPKMLYDFITQNQTLWQGKKIFIIATMGMFSGDGAGILARLLRKYGAEITGGLHLRMPDSIADEKALKHSFEKNKELVRKAEEKIGRAVQDIQAGKPPQDGIGILCRMAGLFGQRLYFSHKTKHYTDKLKIDTEKCIGCGICAKACPMHNLQIEESSGSGNKTEGREMERKQVKTNGRCTMCYRCINLCPRQAITLLGRKVIEQETIEKYL